MTSEKNADNFKHEPKYALIASAAAIATVSTLIILKSIAYFLSGSTAILSTLADSITDAAISLMMLFAVKYSLKPADEQHRHGHGKIEGIASLFQGAFMAAAGLFIIFEAIHKFLSPEKVTHNILGIIIILIAIFLNLILVFIQRYCLKKAPSLAIEADHAHYKTDIFLNMSVIFALFSNYIGAPIWFDPLIAFGVAIYFFITAGKISIKSIDMLMDKEVSKSNRKIIEDIIANNEKALGMHDLRTRKSGMTLHISFDVEMDPDMTLCQSHDVVRELEQEIIKLFPNAEVLIHVDPQGDTEDTRHKVIGIHH